MAGQKLAVYFRAPSTLVFEEEERHLSAHADQLRAALAERGDGPLDILYFGNSEHVFIMPCTDVDALLNALREILRQSLLTTRAVIVKGYGPPRNYVAREIWH